MKPEFALTLVGTDCDDTCEQCDSEEKPVYWLKGNEDNLDTMLCSECLKRLKQTLGEIKI